MPQKRTTVPRVCRNCQRDFQARTDGPGLYCSNACRYTFDAARKNDPATIAARKEARSAYNRAYAAKHLDESRAYRARPDVREKILESKRRSYWNNRDDNLARMRERTPDTLESRRAYRRERLAYYAAASKKWRAEHPNEFAALSAKTSSKKYGLTEHFTGAEWAALKKSFDYRCLRCKKSEPEIKLTVDHVIPRVIGGSNTIDNIQPLCGPCNTAKFNKPIDYRPK